MTTFVPLEEKVPQNNFSLGKDPFELEIHLSVVVITFCA